MNWLNLKAYRQYVVLLACLSFSGWLNAAQVEITWEDPESYADVKPSNESRVRFRERTFKNIEEYFAELAEKLPDDQTLSITVTDLDLAGQVWPSQFVGLGNSTGDVRLIKQIDIPRMKFSYTLSDSSGNVIQSDDVNIKDMGFMDSITVHRNHEGLVYEKAMIKDWYDDTFSEQYIAKK